MSKRIDFKSGCFVLISLKTDTAFNFTFKDM